MQQIELDAKLMHMTVLYYYSKFQHALLDAKGLIAMEDTILDEDRNLAARLAESGIRVKNGVFSRNENLRNESFDQLYELVFFRRIALLMS